MDKLVLSLLLSLLAGFLTAVATFVKLVNDKEAKVTEFRQQWTDSARQALARVVSQLRYFCSLVSEQINLDSDFDRLSKNISKKNSPETVDDNLIQGLLDSQIKEREALRVAFRENRESIHSAYALAKLHFKPDDQEFYHIQNQIDQAISIIDSWRPSRDESSDTLRLKMEVIVESLTSKSRAILKGEWEKIKGGEHSYKQTRIWAKRGGLIGAGALAVVFCWFGVEALLNWKELSDRHIFSNPSSVSSEIRKSQIQPTETDSTKDITPGLHCENLGPTNLTVVQQNLNNDNSLKAPTIRSITPKDNRTPPRLECKNSQ